MRDGKLSHYFGFVQHKKYFKSELKIFQQQGILCEISFIGITVQIQPYDYLLMSFLSVSRL
jgi:hypothetical protein